MLWPMCFLSGGSVSGSGAVWHRRAAESHQEEHPGPAGSEAGGAHKGPAATGAGAAGEARPGTRRDGPTQARPKLNKKIVLWPGGERTRPAGRTATPDRAEGRTKHFFCSTLAEKRAEAEGQNQAGPPGARGPGPRTGRRPGADPRPRAPGGRPAVLGVAPSSLGIVLIH